MYTPEMRLKLPTLVLASLIGLTACSGDKGAFSGSQMDHSGMNMDYKIPATGEATPAPMGGTYLNQALPAEIMAISFTNQKNEKFTFSQLKNKTVVLTNFLTSCQEICPMTSVNMRDIAAKVDDAALSKEIEVLEITVDPARDTPQRMSAYQDLYNDNRWTLATSTEKNINAFWNYFGAPATREEMDMSETMPMDWQTGKPNTYDMMHANLIVIIGKDGKWLWLNIGAPKTTDNKVPPVLDRFLSAQGKKNLAAPQEPSWTVDSVIYALNSITGKNIPVN